MEYTKGERKHTNPDSCGGVNVFTNTEHIAYFDNLGDALLDIAAPVLCEALKALVNGIHTVFYEQFEKDGTVPHIEGYKEAVLALAKAEGKKEGN